MKIGFVMQVALLVSLLLVGSGRASAGDPCESTEQSLSFESWMHTTSNISLVRIVRSELLDKDSRVGSISLEGKSLRNPLAISEFQFVRLRQIKGHTAEQGSFLGVHTDYMGALYSEQLRRTGHFGAKLVELEDDHRCRYLPVVLDVPGTYVISDQDFLRPQQVLKVGDGGNWESAIRRALEDPSE